VIRIMLAICIALMPVVVVALVAWLSGYVDVRNGLMAVVCTAVLLAFAAYRRRDWIRQ
jgi:hypothetical protein